jgi:hypothetical protein
LFAARTVLTGVVFNARPKMKTRPVIVPTKPTAQRPVRIDDDEDEED